MRKTVLPAVAVALVCACAASSTPAPPATSGSVTPTTSSSLAASPALSLAQTGIVAGWMDPAADPCEDYFAYACGGFVKSTVIPPDRAVVERGGGDGRRRTRSSCATCSRRRRSAGRRPRRRRSSAPTTAPAWTRPAIEKAGAQPLKPLLAVVAQGEGRKTLADAVTELHARAIFPLFDVVVAAGLQGRDAGHRRPRSGRARPARSRLLPRRRRQDEGGPRLLRGPRRAHVRARRRQARRGEEGRGRTCCASRRRSPSSRRTRWSAAIRTRSTTRVDRKGLAEAAEALPLGRLLQGPRLPRRQGRDRVNSVAYFTGRRRAHARARSRRRGGATSRWTVLAREGARLAQGVRRRALRAARRSSPGRRSSSRAGSAACATDGALGELLAQEYVKAKFDARQQGAPRRTCSRSIRDAMKAELGALAVDGRAPRAPPPTRSSTR